MVENENGIPFQSSESNAWGNGKRDRDYFKQNEIRQTTIPLTPLLT